MFRRDQNPVKNKALEVKVSSRESRGPSCVVAVEGKRGASEFVKALIVTKPSNMGIHLESRDKVINSTEIPPVEMGGGAEQKWNRFPNFERCRIIVRFAHPLRFHRFSNAMILRPSFSVRRS